MVAIDEGPHRELTRSRFDYTELADKGGLQKAWGLFGKELDALMNDMNEELVA